MADSPVSAGATVLALPADLLFGARIRATAESIGVPVIIAKKVDDLLAHLRQIEARMVILDLDHRSLDITDAITRIKATTPAPLLSYVSHVREDAIREAKQAGATRVIARGAFAHQLADLLKLY